MDYEETEEEQWKTISLQEYNNLIQLIPRVQELQDTINKMAKIIQSKDRNNKKYIDVSSLKTVSSCRKIYYALQELLQCLMIPYNFYIFQEQIEVIDCLVNGIVKMQKYPESVRVFSLNQQYYSTAAYKSLRLFFNKNLPSMRTLQMWYTSIEGRPGISGSALEILREKAESYSANNNHKLHVCLISDEISIRKHLCYCNETQSFVGFSTVTNSSQHNDNAEDAVKLAKDALVFLVVGPDFKIPVAYELLNGLESADRAALTLRVIECIEDTGVKVMSITTDGLAANLVTAETLGAKFDEEKPYLMSPTYPEQKIYFIFDPPHMLKLVRKHFASNNIYHRNELVNWGLLETLVEKQSVNNFNLCNKLTAKHINWHQNEMNVRLAAETISKSSADAIERLHKDGYDEFKNGLTTVEFIRFFDKAFDVLNFGGSRKPDGRYKQKLCANTADHIFNFADKFKQYVKELELQKNTTRSLILLSSAYVGFFGFYMDFVSLKGIYEDYVQNGPLTEFYPFQFSQDHLETFFSLIR